MAMSRRCSLLLLCLFFLCIAFLIPSSAYAAYDVIDTSTGSYSSDVFVEYVTTSDLIVLNRTESNLIWGGAVDVGTTLVGGSAFDTSGFRSGTESVYYGFSLYRNDGASLFTDGDMFVLNLSKFYMEVEIARTYLSSGASFVGVTNEIAPVVESCKNVFITGFTSDGQKIMIYSGEVGEILKKDTVNSPWYYFDISFANNDGILDTVTQIDMRFLFDWQGFNQTGFAGEKDTWTYTNNSYKGGYRFKCGLTSSELLLEVQPGQEDNSGLIAGIIEWLRNILNSIIELPGKIWEAIETGLENFFVPSDGYIAFYIVRWDELLTSTFGALAEAVSIFDDLVESIFNYTPSNSITIPEIVIPVGEDVEFTFGGFEVTLVHERFATIYELLKYFIDFIVTFAFAGMLRKQFYKLLES